MGRTICASLPERWFPESNRDGRVSCLRCFFAAGPFFGLIARLVRSARDRHELLRQIVSAAFAVLARFKVGTAMDWRLPLSLGIYFALGAAAMRRGLGKRVVSRGKHQMPFVSEGLDWAEVDTEGLLVRLRRRWPDKRPSASRRSAPRTRSC